MKKYNLIFLFILTIVCSDILIAQELVKKKKVKDGITNEFYVLKDNKEIKQGPFLSTYLCFENSIICRAEFITSTALALLLSGNPPTAR